MNGSEINMPTLWRDNHIPRSAMILFFTDVIDIEWNRVAM